MPTNINFFMDKWFFWHIFFGLSATVAKCMYQLQVQSVKSNSFYLPQLFDFEDSLPGCWGDQLSCELALKRTNYP